MGEPLATSESQHRLVLAQDNVLISNTMSCVFCHTPPNSAQNDLITSWYHITA